MFRLALAGLLACALSACASTAALDTRIAETSSALAKQCSTVALVIGGAQIYATKPKVRHALAAAEAARAAFCAAPPADETSAVLTLGTVILSVQSAMHS